MKFIRSIRGKFNEREIEILKSKKLNINVSRVDKQNGIYPMNVSFTILEDDDYINLKAVVLSKRNDLFDERKNIHFDEEELKLHNYFFLRFGVPGIANFYSAENCNNCLNPIIQDNTQYHFENEPNLPDRFLFGKMNGFENIIITDIKRSNLIKEYCNANVQPTYFGSKKTKSLNYVALTIPIAKSKLNFGISKFREIRSICSQCGNTYHNGNTLELFPSFELIENVNILFTKEKFIPFLRPIVISKKFAEFLVDYGMISWGPDNLIPLLKPCSLQPGLVYET